ncbi:MAG: hypothetical protein VYA91_14345 [Pseudomonadota bacterium]|nr:hypothetical protein [Pseudomonadota bacterium]
MTILKWGLLVLVVGALVVALVPVVVTQIEKRQAQSNETLLTQPLPTSTNPVAVVVFSRSGNTAVLGREIARRTGGDFYRLEALDYELGLVGWVRAMLDARKGEAVITPETLDLTSYDTVYLGSPIWLYSPAPPIWEFVDNNRFDGQKVVLFNTYNSNFGPDYIETFQQQVLSKGAVSFEHRAVLRGRMGQQLSTEEMLRVFNTQ